VKIHAKADEVEDMMTNVCGGVISVMIIQQMGPIPSEKADTKTVMAMIGRMEVSWKAEGAAVVATRVAALVVELEVETSSRCKNRYTPNAPILNISPKATIYKTVPH